jgi:hypothetical protein
MGKRQRRRTRQQPLSTGTTRRSEPSLWLGPAWASPLDPGQISGLDELAALVDEQRRLAERQRKLVAELVHVGTGWPRIAAALGVSRQAARQQFVRTHASLVAKG